MFFAEKKEAEIRLHICRSCEKYKHHLNICGVCKCFMPMKTKLKKTKCPIGKWGPSEN